jgi:hypothetical protein
MNHNQSGDFVGGLQDAIRQNPVSAALIGMGVLWMFAGGNRITAAAALVPSAARAAAGGIGSGLHSSAEAVGAVGGSVISAGSRVVEGVRDAVSSAAESVGDAVSGAAASVGDAASQAYDSVGDAASQAYGAVKGAVAESAPKGNAHRKGNARHAMPNAAAAGMAGAMQDNLKETFARQPLLLGAIGLAVGAGMAAGLPGTKIESEFAGDTADRVTAQVKEFASEQVDRVTDTAKRTFDAVKQEAGAQGLTPAAAKDGAAAIGDKLKTVAQAARPGSKPEGGRV